MTRHARHRRSSRKEEEENEPEEAATTAAQDPIALLAAAAANRNSAPTTAPRATRFGRPLPTRRSLLPVPPAEEDKYADAEEVEKGDAEDGEDDAAAEVGSDAELEAAAAAEWKEEEPRAAADADDLAPAPAVGLEGSLLMPGVDDVDPLPEPLDVAAAIDGDEDLRPPAPPPGADVPAPRGEEVSPKPPPPHVDDDAEDEDEYDDETGLHYRGVLYTPSGGCRRCTLSRSFKKGHAPTCWRNRNYTGPKPPPEERVRRGQVGFVGVHGGDRYDDEMTKIERGEEDMMEYSDDASFDGGEGRRASVAGDSDSDDDADQFADQPSVKKVYIYRPEEDDPENYPFGIKLADASLPFGPALAAIASLSTVSFPSFHPMRRLVTVGSVILAVNGQNVEGWDLAEVKGLIEEGRDADVLVLALKPREGGAPAASDAPAELTSTVMSAADLDPAHDSLAKTYVVRDRDDYEDVILDEYDVTPVDFSNYDPSAGDPKFYRKYLELLELRNKQALRIGADPDSFDEEEDENEVKGKGKKGKRGRRKSKDKKNESVKSEGKSESDDKDDDKDKADDKEDDKEDKSEDKKKDTVKDPAELLGYPDWINPPNSPALKKWVGEMRQMHASRRPFLSNRDADSEVVRFVLGKLSLLSKSGFVWMASEVELAESLEPLRDTDDEDWRSNCLAYAKFLFSRGHGNVPSHTDLGKWCRTQRARRRENTLCWCKVLTLSSLGFDYSWDADEMADWDGMREKFEDYRKGVRGAKGKGPIAVAPPPNLDLEKEKKKNQEGKKKRGRKKKKKEIPAESEADEDAPNAIKVIPIRVEGEDDEPAAAAKTSSAGEVRAGITPAATEEHAPLWWWAQQQRIERNRLLRGEESELTEERIKSLDEIGFAWDNASAQAAWDRDKVKRGRKRGAPAEDEAPEERRKRLKAFAEKIKQKCSRGGRSSKEQEILKKQLFLEYMGGFGY